MAKFDNDISIIIAFGKNCFVIPKHYKFYANLGFCKSMCDAVHTDNTGVYTCKGGLRKRMCT